MGICETTDLINKLYLTCDSECLIFTSLVLTLKYFNNWPKDHWISEAKDFCSCIVYKI
jgi:hypothetical protein